MSKSQHRWPTQVWVCKRRTKSGDTTYTLRWKDRTGKMRRQTCGRDFALARDLKVRKQEELRAGMLGITPSTTILDLIDRLDVFLSGKEPDTIRKTKESLRLLDRLCEPPSLADIDRGTILDFKALRLAENIAPATLNKHLREIRACLNYAVDGGLLEDRFLFRWKACFSRSRIAA